MSADELPQVPGYTIKRKLAQGGMGVVYAAEDATLGRPVAIKMIRSELLNLEEGDTAEQREVAVARFLREARAAASIRSNHVAHVLQFGRTDDDDLYLVLEFLDGLNLKQVAKKQGPLSVERVVNIGRQLCRGMHAAHELGIVHRDLKPGNVMLVDQDGDPDFVKILDFGVAKMVEDANSEVTQTGSMVGTHTCMAPEQIRGGQVDARTDVYATGVLLFRLLTGRAPFTGADPLVVLHQHLNDPAPKPSSFRPQRDIPPALDLVITRCLEKDPNRRIPTMAELERLLEASLVEGADMSVDPRAHTAAFPRAAHDAPTQVADPQPEHSLPDAETRAFRPAASSVPSAAPAPALPVEPDVGEATPGTNSGAIAFIAPPDTAPSGGSGAARWAIVAGGLFGGVVIAGVLVAVLLSVAKSNKTAHDDQLPPKRPADPAPAPADPPADDDPAGEKTAGEHTVTAAATTAPEDEPEDDTGPDDEDDDPVVADADDSPDKTKRTKTRRKHRRKSDKRDRTTRSDSPKAKANDTPKATTKATTRKDPTARKPAAEPEKAKTQKRPKPNFIRVRTDEDKSE